MMVQRKVFAKLGGFDKKFFASFEDVDLGWRIWISGYKVVVVPQSIVYHMKGQTQKEMKNEMEFHGLKNQLSMKITNFESKVAIKSLFLFFIVYGIRELRILLDYKLKGSTHLTSTKYEEKIAEKRSIKIIVKALIWILTNVGYLREKQKKVNSYRKISTKELEKMNILTNDIQ